MQTKAKEGVKRVEKGGRREKKSTKNNRTSKNGIASACRQQIYEAVRGQRSAEKRERERETERKREKGQLGYSK